MEPKARPFLKWSGGKTQLLPELLKRVPEIFGTYHEPFVGAGALFFALQPQVAHLGDVNGELVTTWQVIQQHVDLLVEELRCGAYTNREELFYTMRSSRPDNHVTAAARTIYLNKTCYNGLYRVNKKGDFNAPFGRFKNPKICDEINLRAVSEALHDNVSVAKEDFTAVLGRAQPGDFVYFDPPYVPLTKTSSFTAYTAGGFGLDQHQALRDVALVLKRKGVHILLSNSASPIVEELYGADFTIERVQARRNINSKGTGRGAITEFLIS